MGLLAYGERRSGSGRASGPVGFARIRRSGYGLGIRPRTAVVAQYHSKIDVQFLAGRLLVLDASRRDSFVANSRR